MVTLEVTMIVMYFRKLSYGLFMYLLLYVDDILISSKNIFEISSLKDQLSGEFEIKGFKCN